MRRSPPSIKRAGFRRCIPITCTMSTWPIAIRSRRCRRQSSISEGGAGAHAGVGAQCCRSANLTLKEDSHSDNFPIFIEHEMIDDGVDDNARMQGTRLASHDRNRLIAANDHRSHDICLHIRLLKAIPKFAEHCRPAVGYRAHRVFMNDLIGKQSQPCALIFFALGPAVFQNGLYDPIAIKHDSPQFLRVQQCTGASIWTRGTKTDLATCLLKYREPSVGLKERQLR